MQDTSKIARINAQIRAILDDCTTAEKPLERLASHALRIKSDPSWSRDDAWEVVITALRILPASLNVPDCDESTSQTLSSPASQDQFSSGTVWS